MLHEQIRTPYTQVASLKTDQVMSPTAQATEFPGEHFRGGPDDRGGDSFLEGALGAVEKHVDSLHQTLHALHEATTLQSQRATLQGDDAPEAGLAAHNLLQSQPVGGSQPEKSLAERGETVAALNLAVEALQGQVRVSQSWPDLRQSWLGI